MTAPLPPPALRESGPAVGVSVLVRKGPLALLVRRARPPHAGLWAFPGGHVRRGEMLEDAASRELAEETGVAAAAFRQIATLDLIHRSGETLASHHVLVVFTAVWQSGEPVAADDAAAAGWFGPGEWGGIDLTPETSRILAALAALAPA